MFHNAADLPAQTMGNKKPASAYAKTGSIWLALAAFIMRPQAETLKSAQKNINPTCLICHHLKSTNPTS
jgi:hypothetical protein